jgi:uncharacterized protein (DUF1015 family)
MLALGAQTGPVFLVYRARADIDRSVAAAAAGEALIDFTAADGVRHTVWRVTPADRDCLVEAVSRVPALYIADGHHRAASAARARAGLGLDTFLAVAFPHDQPQILPYNRVVKDLAGSSPVAFLERVRARFAVTPGAATPARGQIAMYLQGAWHTLTSQAPRGGDTIAALDVSVLQDELLAPILNVADVTTDPRIEFVGGGRGTAALERLVDSGRAAVAFSLHPVDLEDLMAVSDAGGIMPPKSTWFEPKLRDGLLVHAR